MARRRTRAQQRADNQAAAARDYRVYRNDCNELLEKIAAGLALHEGDAQADDGPHYGHCGDLQHLRHQLQQLSDSLHHEGEYAAD